MSDCVVNGRVGYLLRYEYPLSILSRAHTGLVRTGSAAVLRAFGLLPFLRLKVHVVRLGKLFEHLVVLR